MSDNLEEKTLKLQKIIRSVVGSVGVIATFGTLIIGLCFILKLSQTFLGMLLLLGMVPLDILITLVAIKSVKVECVNEIDDYDEDLKEKDYCGLTLVERKEDVMEEELGYKSNNCIKTTSDGIAPIVHLEVVNSDNKGYTRKRVIRKDKNKN